MRTFEFKLKRNKAGVFAMSIVDEPAMLVDFLKLSKYKESKMQLAINEDQKIVTGPAIIPNFKIIRSAEFLDEEEDGYMYFSEKTTKQLSELFMTDERMNNITLGHETKSTDLKLTESWIILDPKKDKSLALGYDLPKGTWMISYKVQNDDLWKRIKLGEFNGFSIEAVGFDKVEKELDMSLDKELTLNETTEIILTKFVELEEE